MKNSEPHSSRQSADLLAGCFRMYACSLKSANGRRLQVGSGNERPRGVGQAPQRRFDGPLGLELFDPVELLDEPVRLGGVLLLLLYWLEWLVF